MVREPVATGASTQHTARWRAVHAGAGSALLARALSITCTLAQVPIALKHLGAEGFGLWMTITSIAGLLTMGDLGLNLSARTILAEAYGSRNLGLLRVLADECFRQLIRLGGVFAAIGCAAALLINWQSVFAVRSEAIAAKLPLALIGLAVTAGVVIPANLGITLAAAAQWTWVQHAAAAAGGVLTLLIVVWSSLADLPWIAVVLSTLFLSPAINFSILLWARQRLGWTEPSGIRATAEQRRRLLRLGHWFMVPQIGSLFMTMSLPVAIAAAAGPLAVAAFNILQRVFGVVTQLHWMSLLALWPAYSEAHARQDFAWMREAYRRSWIVTVFLFIPAMLLLAFVMPHLVSIWVGESAPVISAGLLWLCATWFCVQLLGQPPSLVLNGLARLRGVALYGSLGHVISLAGMIVGGYAAGAFGVVAGMAIGYVSIGLPVAINEARRALGCRRK